MSLFGALTTGVSTLTAQSDALSVISNNIANIDTTGYKSEDTNFSDMVTSSNYNTDYSPGGVRASTVSSMNLQGTVAQTSSVTDLAISGSGFFVVKADTSTASTSADLYTRAGSFTENSDGYLVNANGFYLEGWRCDASGNVSGSSSADTSSLVPVDVSYQNGISAPTENVSLTANLDSATATTDAAPQFSRDITVYDSLGTAQTLTMNFTKTGTNAWTVDFMNGSTNVGSQNISFTNSGQIGQNTASPTAVLATPTAAAPGVAQVSTATFPTGAPAVGQDYTLNVGGTNYSVTYDGNTYSSEGSALTGLAAQITSGSGGAYTASCSNGVISITATATNTAFTTANDPVTTVAAAPSGSAGATANLAGINWGDGSASQGMAIDMSGITQFSSTSTVTNVNQDGAALGTETGVTIDGSGYVTASFTNGETLKLYKIPIATFTNPNGLASQSGDVYSQTSDSGSYNLQSAGTGPAGTIDSSSLESSNVDLSDQFTQMIIAQRAYSAGSKVVTTVDTMLQDLLQIQ